MASDDRRARLAQLRRRLRYRFDLALARGPIVVVGYLGLVMVAIIVFAAMTQTLLGLTGVNGDTRGLRFDEAFWQSMLRVLDTGTMASDTHWATRLLSLFVTLSGIFLAGSLIGLIASAVDQKVEQLRKGRGAVYEEGHTLILGWSPRLPVVLAELVEANANHERQVVVVLADRPADEMEDDLRRAVPQRRTTRIVCRTGSPTVLADLHLVHIEQARSVMILSGDGGDAEVVKTFLAVRSLDPGFERTRLVAELRDREYAATLRALTGRRIGTVCADEVISQVTAQACYQNGLAAVFRDLLDFDGDEFYFQAVPELVGHTFFDAAGAFERASVVGLHRDGRVMLNPSPSARIELGDQIIAVAGDDDQVVFTGFAGVAAGRVDGGGVATARSQIAVVGWSAFGFAVLRELDQFLAEGSVIHLLVDPALCPPESIVLPQYDHCSVEVFALPDGPEAVLARLGRESYEQMIVLCYRDQLSITDADTRSMLTLLALNRAWAGRSSRPRVVAELLDGANVPLAETTGVDDFIVSDELSSLMLAQLSERLELQDVFAELFDASGCYLSLQPARFLAPAAPTTFGVVVATAMVHGACAIGYRLAGSPAVLNPPKSTPLTLGPDDEILVIAGRAARAKAPSPTPGPAASALVLEPVAPEVFGPTVLDREQAPRITDAPRPDGMAALNGDSRIRPNAGGRHARS